MIEGFMTERSELVQAVIAYIYTNASAEKPVTNAEMADLLNYAEPDRRALMRAISSITSTLTTEDKHFHRTDGKTVRYQNDSKAAFGYWFDHTKRNPNLGQKGALRQRYKRVKSAPKPRIPLTYPTSGNVPWAKPDAAQAPVVPQFVQPSLFDAPEPDQDPLLDHVIAMQEMAARYVAPGPYVDREGKSSDDALPGLRDPMRTWLFAQDMVYMLDGPEQRAAMLMEEIE